MTPRDIAAVVATEALPYLGSPDVSKELANNFVCGLLNEQAEPQSVAVEMIRHRIAHFGLACGDVECCARVMALAWLRAQAPEVAAA